jgi:Na+-transporting NADH:ubiquinone oxidoreductase subunit C
MNINSNLYTIGFACVMVVLIAALLASLSIKLTPFQDRNIELEKKQNILQSVGIYVDREASEASYSKYIQQELVLDYKGNVVEGSAFNVDLGDE